MFKWTMKLCLFHSLQNPLPKRLYLPSKPKTLPTQFVYSAKHIQTLLQFSTDAQTTPIQSSVQTLNFISYSKLLSQCAASKSVRVGMEVHAHLIRFGFSQDQSFRNHLINLYGKCRFFGHARKLIDGSPEPDLVAWSALISGYAQNGLGKEALLAFHEMHGLGVKCNEFTFPSILKACSSTKVLGLGKQVHGVVVVTGFESDEFVANTLVVMYSKCGEFGDSRRLFYSIPERNVVSWNALFSCYMQSDFFGEAMDLFEEMVLSGIRPNEYSLSSIINACTGLGDGSRGRPESMPTDFY